MYPIHRSFLSLQDNDSSFPPFTSKPLLIVRDKNYWVISVTWESVFFFFFFFSTCTFSHVRWSLPNVYGHFSQIPTVCFLEMWRPVLESDKDTYLSQVNLGNLLQGDSPVSCAGRVKELPRTWWSRLWMDHPTQWGPSQQDHRPSNTWSERKSLKYVLFPTIPSLTFPNHSAQYDALGGKHKSS